MVGKPEACTEKRSEGAGRVCRAESGALVLELLTGPVSHDELLAHEQRHLSDSSIARSASVLADATLTCDDLLA
jgi:hypothetical protein